MMRAYLLTLVAEAWDLTVDEVRTPTKRRDIIAARAAYAELARRYTRDSSREIAEPIRSCGKSVSHGWRLFAGRMAHADFAAKFSALDAVLARQLPRTPERRNTQPKPWLKGKRHKPRPKLPSEILRAPSSVNDQIEKAYLNG